MAGGLLEEARPALQTAVLPRCAAAGLRPVPKWGAASFAQRARLPARRGTAPDVATKPWDKEARASRRSGLFGLKSGTARQQRASASAASSPAVEQQEAVGPRGKSGSVFELRAERRGKSRRGDEEGREGPSGQRAFPGQGTFRVPRLCLRWATSLRAGLVLAVLGPFALVLLWLPGERGDPVKEGESPCLRTAGETELSGPPPSYPLV
ncbi:uncharacterized protein LOC115916668 [Camarhynchus parvulus]|uniref:uncharacterized protein LOC115916668 n=1 Tax=Geospiza parvula TaxID=87175 RepID=UPI001237A3FA|nr:uncharacterized protein LOC115916668 [Camarhynchus parvulus]